MPSLEFQRKLNKVGANIPYAHTIRIKLNSKRIIMQYLLTTEEYDDLKAAKKTGKLRGKLNLLIFKYLKDMQLAPCIHISGDVFSSEPNSPGPTNSRECCNDCPLRHACIMEKKLDITKNPAQL